MDCGLSGRHLSIAPLPNECRVSSNYRRSLNIRNWAAERTFDTTNPNSRSSGGGGSASNANHNVCFVGIAY